MRFICDQFKKKDFRTKHKKANLICYEAYDYPTR